METLLLYALLTPSLFYLGSRAVITEFLWRRYPAKLSHFMDCSACSGTWYGAIVGYIGGYHMGLNFLGMPGAHPLTVLAIAVGSMTWTPIVAGLVQAGFDRLGSVVPEPEPEPEPEQAPVPVGERTCEVKPTLFAEHPDLAAGLTRSLSSAYGATIFGPDERPDYARIVVDAEDSVFGSSEPPRLSSCPTEIIPLAAFRRSTVVSTHHISPAPLGGYTCSCGKLFSPRTTIETDHAVAVLDQALRHEQATTVLDEALRHAEEADEADKVNDGPRAG